MSDAPRSPELEWARRAAADGLSGLDWVDADLDPDRTAWEQTGAGEQARWLAVSMARYLPPAMTEATWAAQRRGEVTLPEAYQLLFARLQWFARTRPLYWTPSSPLPRLLTHLLEAHGIGPDVHAGDPERLVRIAARLKVWRRRRGELGPALELLREGAGIEPDELLTEGPTDEEEPPVHLGDEVLCCRSEAWWAARRTEGARVLYRIEGGALRFQRPDAPGFPLLREDVLVELPEDGSPARPLLRLLPAWVSARPVLPMEKSR